MESSGQHCESDRISVPCKRFKELFVTQGACKNVKGMIVALNIKYNLEEW